MVLIDKETIRAEIERRWKELADKNVKAGGGKYDAEISTYLSVLAFLDTLPEQPVEGLQEEVKRYYSDNFDYISSNQPTLSILTNIARHFAEWGMNQCPLPEDTTIFMKGVAEGKRLMMEEAVAVEVIGEKRDLRLIDSTQRCLFNAERGDWLKIIIVKEDGK